MWRSPSLHVVVGARQPGPRTLRAVNSPASTATDPSRSVALAGVFNFRDLGGYGAIDGRLGALGSTVPVRLTGPADPRRRRRAPSARPSNGDRSPWDRRGGHRRLVPRRRVSGHAPPPIVMDREWTRPPPISAPPANSCTPSTRRCSTRPVHGTPTPYARLALPGALPAVFHCAAGKDRTGLLAMLVLGALGVSDSDIVDDYALTAATMDAFLAARSADPAFADRIAALPATFFAASGRACTSRRRIAAAHGSIRAYVLSLGVTADELACPRSCRAHRLTPPQRCSVRRGGLLAEFSGCYRGPQSPQLQAAGAAMMRKFMVGSVVGWLVVAIHRWQATPPRGALVWPSDPPAVDGRW